MRFAFRTVPAPEATLHACQGASGRLPSYSLTLKVAGMFLTSRDQAEAET